MNEFALASLLSFVGNLCLGCLVFQRNPKNILNRIFFLYCLSASYLSFVEYGYRLADTVYRASYWMNLIDLWLFAFPLELHFVLIFTEKKKLLENKVTYLLLYVPAILILLCLRVFTEAEPIEVYWGWTYRFVPETHLIIIFFEIWIAIINLFILYIGLWYYITTKDQTKKRQSKYILAGISFAVISYCIPKLGPPVLGIMVPELITIGYVLEAICFAYAIWKHKLFSLTPETAARNIISTMADALMLVNPEGRIVTVNKATVELLGYKGESLIGRPVSMLFAQGQSGLSQKEWQKLKETTSLGGQIEIFLKTKDARKIPVSLSGSVMRDDDGAVHGLIFVGRDLTERNKLQEQLVQSQKMEAIGRFAGGITHDFYNVLTSIMGNADLLLMRLDGDRTSCETAKEIQKAAQRAANLTRQLLAFSRKQVLQPEVLNLNSVITDMEKMLRRLIGEDVEVESALEQQLGNVEADPGQIQQVIMNLAVNARDAMPQGGKLTIETANLELDEIHAGQSEEVKPGSYVMLAVSDTGVGMDREVQSRIFEPFFTTKELDKGTGLGLSTVYGIVKQSEGYIWVYSEAGRGTTFKVLLPRIDKDIERKESEHAVQATSGGFETILLVEDDDLLRKMAQDLLHLIGYNTLVAKNGEEALKLCERHEGPIHMVLTDLVMPGISGLVLSRLLKAIRPETKVLYMSAYTDHAIVNHKLFEPAEAFLQKPFSVEALSRKVRHVLDAPK